jgi:amidohydrolase
MHNPAIRSLRQHALISALICVLLTALPGQGRPLLSGDSATSGPATRDAQFDKDVQAMFAKLVEMRRDLHMHPELPNQEVRTSRIVAERLRALGLEVKTGIARHGVIGLLKGGRPGGVVAVRADMDALPINETRNVPYKSQTPGVMHACGHDVHTAVALGVAELLSKHREQIPGTVKFIFQPAEEMASDAPEWGAKLMIRENALDNPRPSAIFGLHTSASLEAGRIGFSENAVTAAADTFAIRIRGRMSHGAYPQLGSDAIVVASAAVMQLQTIRSRRTDTMEPLVLTIGSFHGGNRENIIAEEVELKGTVRTYSEAMQEQVIQQMHQTLKGVTESFGASYLLDYKKGYPPTINNAPLVRRMLPTMKRINGETNVLAGPPSMGGEDFSYFAKEVPGFFYWLGVASRERGITAGNHTPDFDADEQCLATGVKTMAAMIVDYLEQEGTKQ